MGNYSYPVRVPGRTFSWQNTNGSVSSSLTGSSILLANNEVKSGSSLPGYKAKILKGLNATTSYIRSGYKLREPMLYRMRSFERSPGFKVESYLEKVDFPLEPSYSFTTQKSSLSQEAASIIRRKLRNFTGQSNQLINIAELRELPRTLGTLAKSATKLIEAVNSKKHRGASLRRYASDQWLNWSFGILPTLSAIDDTVSSIQSYLDRVDHTDVEYGVKSTDWLSAKTSTNTGSHWMSVKNVGSFRHSLSVKITAGYRYQLLSSNNYTLGKHLGFDISSVVPTVYELIPYSWLLDYFTTAGQFVEDTFTAEFGDSIYICENTIFRVEGSVTPVPVPTVSRVVLADWYGKPQKLEYFWFQRASLTSLPRAPLRFKTSNEIANNAVNKLLNLASLLGSRH